MNVLELILNGEKRDVEVEKYKEIAEFQYFP
jgi:hypothetical protein